MKPTPADEKILECLNQGKSFLLDAGAGSGKTTSLIRALNEIRGANWNQYSFGNLLSGADKSEDRLKRSRNLFYVACSRAKRNLAVIDLGQGASKDKIAALFGASNCVF